MPKIIKKLKETEARHAKPKDKPYKINDEGGLRLLIRPSGAKVWQVPYQIGKKANIYTIGKYSPIEREGFFSLAQARKVRDGIKVQIASGIDPNKQKQAQRNHAEHSTETTFEAIAREWHGKGIWVKGHADRIISSLEKDVFPIIGNKQIDQVTKKDVIVVVSKIEARGALDVAKRTCQRCEAIFDYSIHRELCENNPAFRVSKFIETHTVQHRPFLRENELPEFLYHLDQYHGRDYTDDEVTVGGTLDVICKPPLRWLAPIMKGMGQIPAHNEENVPVTVCFKSDRDTKFFHFVRTFHFKNAAPYVFHSRMMQIRDNEVIEIMRFGLGWKMLYSWDGEKVILQHKGYALHLFGHFIPLPLTLLMGKGYAEEIAVDENTFDMITYITHPVWGKVYEYKGRFEIAGK